jgi:hypothetical protein
MTPHTTQNPPEKRRQQGEQQRNRYRQPLPSEKYHHGLPFHKPKE